MFFFFFFFQAEDGIRDPLVTGVQTCALPILQQRDIKSRQPSSEFSQGGAESVALSEVFGQLSQRLAEGAGRRSPLEGRQRLGQRNPRRHQLSELVVKFGAL